jgi:hypothetical protein
VRDIEIVLENQVYTVGDLIEGHMIVKCDKSFKYNRIHITLEGKERVDVKVGAGHLEHWHVDDRVHYEERLDFEESGEMQPEEHVYSFSFRIPEDALPSFRGNPGYNEYSLNAKVEISRGRDLKEKVTIAIRKPIDITTSEARSVSTEKDGVVVFRVDLERDVLCLGDELRFKVKVAKDVDIKQMRIELIPTTNVIAKKHTYTFLSESQKLEIDGSEIPKDMWYNVVMLTDYTMRPSYHGEILQHFYVLKVTLNLPWRRKTKIEIPLNIGFSLSSIEEDMKKGMIIRITCPYCEAVHHFTTPLLIDTQLKCPNCARTISAE